MSIILKRFFATFLAFCVLGFFPIYAQLETKKLQKEIKRQVKALEKEGWKPAYGTKPIAEQIRVLNVILSDVNNEYIVGKCMMDANETSYNDYNTAHRVARECALTDLASMLETHISSHTTSIIDNDSSSIESTAWARTIMRMQPEEQETILDLYRQLNNGCYQFMVDIAIKKDKIKPIK